jgi:hypothetical protein
VPIACHRLPSSSSMQPQVGRSFRENLKTMGYKCIV